MADSQDLESKTVAELRTIAKNMGIKGITGLRKYDLIEHIRQTKDGEKPAPSAQPKVEQLPVIELPQPAVNRVNRRAVREPGQSVIRTFDGIRRAATADSRGADAVRDDSSRRAPDARASEGGRMGVRRVNDGNHVVEVRDEAPRQVQPGQLDLDLDLPRRRRRTEMRGDAQRRESSISSLDSILANLPDHSAAHDENSSASDDRHGWDDRAERRSARRGRDSRGAREGRGLNERTMNDRGANERPGRMNRQDRNRQDRSDFADRPRTEREPRVHQDNLESVAGIVDVLDSYAFIRTSGYLPGPNDVYVSMSQVRKYGLRKGDAVHGKVRANSNDANNRNGRNNHQKFVPLLSLDDINGMPVEDAQHRPQFNKLTPLYPQERLKMETTSTQLVGRMIDLCAPIGKGQRGLIVSPPKAGKTITLQRIANAITTNNPEVHLMVVLVDERPEEVTDMERTVHGEVISSTFDRPASDHTIVAELAIERAKRLVELGQDVVVLLDSMTRLARAYNIAAPASGRILSGGVDAQALYPPKKFFGAARNIENGGSLTIIASALVETGSKMDEVIFEEFKGTGNMELRLSRDLAEKRMFPAIDINASGTRREELITDPKELMIIYRLRRALGGMEPEQAYNTIVPRLKRTPTNRDFLVSLATGQVPAATAAAAAGV
ncbi:MAG: transcription termination factor Rho [Bifidobacteriaceae bacterium]|nr:transcription termination factor Rho [Bifidobacteriaceae bacterium]